MQLPHAGQIPRGSLLWPSDGAAVVGGNVLTSQRVVDVILRAFDFCAASQVYQCLHVHLWACVCVCVC
jgi:N-methylhydantoinase B/oxoprolinase/acetone carboxylase alpha subunit